MTELLEATIEDIKLRSSCGFMLVAVDSLGRIRPYGFDAADEVLAEVAGRIRRQMRGKDHLARFSGASSASSSTTARRRIW
jgi:GGDEF domain-containing protein